jgi:hypothetical protein
LRMQHANRVGRSFGTRFMLHIYAALAEEEPYRLPTRSR